MAMLRRCLQEVRSSRRESDAYGTSLMESLLDEARFPRASSRPLAAVHGHGADGEQAMAELLPISGECRLIDVGTRRSGGMT